MGSVATVRVGVAIEKERRWLVVDDPLRAGKGHRHSSRLAVLLPSIVAAIGIAIAVWWAWPRENSSAVLGQASVPTIAQPLAAAQAKSAPRLSIGVLPFSNLSNDPDQEYFADGVTDDLTTDLSRISGSFVIAHHRFYL
jgi:hypothetical protein